MKVSIHHPTKGAYVQLKNEPIFTKPVVPTIEHLPKHDSFGKAEITQYKKAIQRQKACFSLGKAVKR